MKTRSSKPADFLVVLGLTLMLVLPAWLTLRTVQSPRPLVPLEDNPATPGFIWITPAEVNPTPFGYTWSLLLFLVPGVAIGWKVMSLRNRPEVKRAFWLTLGLLIPVGFALDAFFGMRFFTFVNKGATLGWNLPGYVPGSGFQNVIPFEEYAFYALGFLVILLAYVWADQVWLSAYSDGDPPSPRRPVIRNGRWRELARTARRAAAHGLERLGWSPWSPFLAGAVLVSFAWLIKRHGPEACRDGIPSYFLFLVAGSVVPSMVCFRIAARRINWRAFSFSFIFLLVISLFWEATLGVPYQWWGYRQEAMMGIFANGLSELPLEAALVWAFANWTTALLYETILAALQLGVRPFWRIFFMSNTALRRLFQAGGA